MNSKCLTLKWMHGGSFVKVNDVESYVGGRVEYERDIDVDWISYFELLGRAKDLCQKNDVSKRNVSRILKYWSLGEAYSTFNELRDDNDVGWECSLLESGETLELFVDHAEAAGGPYVMPTEEVESQSGVGDPTQAGRGTMVIEHEDGCPNPPTHISTEATLDSYDPQHEHFPEVNEDPSVSDNKSSSEAEDSEDEDYVHEDEDDSDVDWELKSFRNLIRKEKRRKRAEAEPSAAHVTLGPAGNDDGFRGEEELNEQLKGRTGGHEPYYNSSDPDSRAVTDDEQENFEEVENQVRALHYDPNRPVPYWELGMVFESVTQFREAIDKYVVVRCLDLTKRPNEPLRVRVKCREGCPWTLFGSKDTETGNFTINTYYPRHRCTRTNRTKQCSAKFIAKHFKKTILSQPGIKIKALQKLCEDTLKVFAGRSICSRAKKIVMDSARGDYVKEFKLIHQYADYVVKTNPGSTCFAKCKRIDDSTQQFKRFYMSLGAVKDGFLAGCRHIIGLDGCFLKTITGGQLLIAVSKDGNDQMYPIAWAVMDIEDSKNWIWFISTLKQDLGIINGLGWTLITDMQKGLANAINQELPEAEHRMCARHIWSNWRKKWRGEDRRVKFWEVARAPFEALLRDKLKELGKLGNSGIVEDLLYYNKELWCRAYFSVACQCPVVENNMSETFNSWILNSRSKSIITMCEEIRTQLMNRIRQMRDFSNTWICSFSPAAMERLEKNKIYAMSYHIEWNGESGFEVIDGEYKHTVDLRAMKCSCRYWELRGIPCAHAVCAMFHRKMKPEEFVAHWYHKRTFLKAYQYSIQPIPGMNIWPDSDFPLVLPPDFEQRKAGRPKTARKRAVEEPKRKTGKKSRVGTQMTCTVCKQNGHNRRGCGKKGNSTAITDSAGTSASGQAAPAQTTPSLIVTHARAQAQFAPAQSAPTTTESVPTVITRAAKRKAKHVQTNIPTTRSRGPVGMGININENNGMVHYKSLTKPPRMTKPPSGTKSSADVTGEIGFKAAGLKWKGKTDVTARQLENDQRVPASQQQANLRERMWNNIMQTTNKSNSTPNAGQQSSQASQASHNKP